MRPSEVHLLLTIQLLQTMKRMAVELVVKFSVTITILVPLDNFQYLEATLNYLRVAVNKKLLTS